MKKSIHKTVPFACHNGDVVTDEYFYGDVGDDSLFYDLAEEDLARTCDKADAILDRGL